MKWSNLKLNKCPKCDKEFGFQAFSAKKGFIICACGFGISESRFGEIVHSQVTQQLQDKWDGEYGTM